MVSVTQAAELSVSFTGARKLFDELLAIQSYNPFGDRQGCGSETRSAVNDDAPRGLCSHNPLQGKQGSCHLGQ